MNLKQALRMAAFFAGFAVHAQAASISVDGDPNNRGPYRNGALTDWTPNALIAPSRYTVEDQTGYSATRLFPGDGGQAHDAKAFHVYMDTAHLYPTRVTGLSPDTLNGPKHKSHGSSYLAIDFNRDDRFESGIETTDADAGKVYQVSLWDYGLWNHGQYNPRHPDLKHPASINAGMFVSDVAHLVYTGKYFTHVDIDVNDKHSVDAAAPFLTFTGFARDFDMHRSMNRGDDVFVTSETTKVPEPTILALMALGFLALALLQRKKPLLSLPWAEPPVQKTKPKSRFSTAKLLRRDIRNNTLLFKYLHQRKYNFL